MSETFSLACHETKLRVWIGQGWGQMTSFYTGEPGTMERLRQFLNAHLNKPLVFVCNDRDETVHAYDEFELESDEGDG